MKHPSLKEKLAIAVLAFVASISWIACRCLRSAGGGLSNDPERSRRTYDTELSSRSCAPGAGQFLKIRTARVGSSPSSTGLVWVTQAGDPRDAFVAKGGVFEFDRQGLAVVEAFKESRLAVFATAGEEEQNMNLLWSDILVPKSRDWLTRYQSSGRCSGRRPGRSAGARSVVDVAFARFHAAVQRASHRAAGSADARRMARRSTLLATTWRMGGRVAVGEARYALSDERNDAREFALVVADQWQRLGCRHGLMQELMQHAAAVRGEGPLWRHLRRQRANA